jgi:hypothetical protein
MVAFRNLALAVTLLAVAGCSKKIKSDIEKEVPACKVKGATSVTYSVACNDRASVEKARAYLESSAVCSALLAQGARSMEVNYYAIDHEGDSKNSKSYVWSLGNTTDNTCTMRDPLGQYRK